MRLKRRVLLFVVPILALSGCSQSPEVKEAKYLQEGKTEFGKKNYTTAVVDFKNASVVKPWDAEPHYQLGLTYLAANNVKSAGEDLKRATDLNPRHTGAQLKLAELMASSHDKGTLEEAQKHAKAVLAQLPDDPDALVVLGMTDLRLGKPEGAQSWLERSVNRSPGHVRSWAGLAEVKLARNDVAGAEKALLESCTNAPKSPEARNYLGEFYLAHGRSKEAEQQFRQSVAIDPKNGPALMRLGAMQMRAGQTDQAAQTYRQVASLPDKQYKPIDAEFLFSSGKQDQAVAELEKLGAADPGDVNLRTKLVEAYLALNRPGDAEKALTAALKHNPLDVVALMQRGRLYLNSGKYAEAQADMNQVLRFSKNAAEAHYVLAKIGKAHLVVATEKQELEEALRIDPAFLPARIDLTAALLDGRDPHAALLLVDEAPKEQMNDSAVIVKRNWALLALGQKAEARKGIDRLLATGKVPEAFAQDAELKLDEKDYAAARKSAEEVLSKMPGNTRALSTLVETYTEQKQMAAGVQVMREYALKQPESAPVQEFLGQILNASGDRAGARKAFEAARAKGPAALDPDFALAELDANEGKLDEAGKTLLDVTASHPDNKIAHLRLANFQMATGKNPAAIEQFRKVIALDGKDANAWNSLGYLLAEGGGKLDEALKCAQKAKELAPSSPDVDDTLGWIYYLQGSYPLAVVHLEAATAKGGEGAVVSEYHLAMAYRKAGKTELGRQVLDAALKMNSNVPEAQAARQAFGIGAR